MNKSADLLRYLDLNKKKLLNQNSQIFSNFINFFKIFYEYMNNLKKLKRGKFTEKSLLIYHNLPKLLLNIDNLMT